MFDIWCSSGPTDCSNNPRSIMRELAIRLSIQCPTSGPSALEQPGATSCNRKASARSARSTSREAGRSLKRVAIGPHRLGCLISDTRPTDVGSSRCRLMACTFRTCRAPRRMSVHGAKAGVVAVRLSRDTSGIRASGDHELQRVSGDKSVQVDIQPRRFTFR